ncbi:MAG: DUF2470 domain-containing protein [Candidatus Nanopelagicales bacterium]
MQHIGEQRRSPSEQQQRPTAAELARTIVSGPYSGSVLTDWLDSAVAVSFWVDHAGRIVLFVSDGHPLARVSCLQANTAADFIVDAVSVQQGPDRRTASVEMTGRLSPVNPTDAAVALTNHARARGLEDVTDLGRLWTLELRPDRIEVNLAAGSHLVDVADYLAASPDPLAQSAHRIAEHLNSSHREVLLELLPGVPPTTPVTMVGLDRYGIDLQVGEYLRRVCFKNPLTRKEELGRELFELRRLRVHA